MALVSAKRIALLANFSVAPGMMDSTASLIHGGAAKSTLSRCISDIISSSNQSGKGGSCRSASSSKALTSNLTLESLLEAGEWYRESTFLKFYNKSSITYNRAMLEANNVE